MSSRQRDYYIGYCTPYGSGFVFKFTPLSLNVDFHIQTLAVYFEFDCTILLPSRVSHVALLNILVLELISYRFYGIVRTLEDMPLNISINYGYEHVIPGEGGTLDLLGNVIVWYMGDQSKLYTVSEGDQLVDQGRADTTECVVNVHSRLVPHPDAGQPSTIMSEHLYLRYKEK